MSNVLQYNYSLFLTIFKNPSKDTWRIEVRILRLWRNYNKESGNTIEMVFVFITTFFKTQNRHILYLLYNEQYFFYSVS